MTEHEKLLAQLDGQLCKKCGERKHRGKCFSKDIVHVQRRDMEMVAKALSDTEWPFLKALTTEVSNAR